MPFLTVNLKGATSHLLQGSIAAHISYGEIFITNDFVIDFILSLSVKGFRKSVGSVLKRICCCVVQYMVISAVSYM